MDVILDFCDHYALDQAYAYLLPYPHTPSALTQLNNTGMPLSYDSAITNHPAFKPTSYLPRDSMIRQSISLYIIAAVGAAAMYFLFCSISYFCFFDRRLEHHPRFLKNQIRMEIKSSMIAIPWIDAMTLPWFLGEIRGHSMIYDNVSDYGWTYFVFSVALYLLFTDFFIYWIHRLEHHPSIYKHVHKPHHKWIMPTPWAALAFHPVDGYAQSLPYHIFVYVFPLHKYLYLGLFVFVQLWTILIHDGDMISGHFFERYINSPAHHTLHHLYFTCNYGQYFTWADSYFDSYRSPEPELDPLLDSLKMMKKKGLIDEAGNLIPQKKKDQ